MPKRKRFNSLNRKDFSNQDKKVAKIGILSDNVMSYYRNVSTMLENGFDVGDDEVTMKDNFLTNVYNTLKDEGIQVSQNQTVSRILEMLFKHSQPHHMMDIFCQFCGNLAIVTFDRFASHVFQSLIQHLPAIYESVVDADSAYIHHKGKIHTSIEQLHRFMESHMRDIMVDTYGSHVLRSFLESLGGVKVKEEVIRSHVSRIQCKEMAVTFPVLHSYSISQDFKQSFKTLIEKIIQLCNFEDHLTDPCYCPVLQTVLLILNKTSPKKYNYLVQLILDKTCVLLDSAEVHTIDVSKGLPDLMQSEVGSYLIELIISLASKDQLSHLFEKFFKGKLIYFAVHPIANHILQKFLDVVVDSVMMQELLRDITQYLEDILAVGHIGIITKLAQACRNTQTGQDDFLQAILAAFHCLKPVDKQIKIVPLITSLQTYDVFFTDQNTKQEKSNSLLKTVNIHGSLLLQQMLQFTKPSLVVSSLLNLTPTELVGLCCDKCGSHVIDTYFKSPTVLESNKFLFLNKLKGLYANVACNRNGSRCLESIWKGSPLKSKVLIAEELSKSQERIEGDQWGHFLYKNFALFKFSQRRKEWMDIQGASTKKQQLLNDILQGKERNKKQKKQLEEMAVGDEMTVVETITDVSSAANNSEIKVKKYHTSKQETDFTITEIREKIGMKGKKKAGLECNNNNSLKTKKKRKRNSAE